MSILDNLKRAHAAIVVDLAKKAVDPADNTVGKLSPQVNSLAVEALTGGIDSQAWKDYMSLFASNAAELAQLSDPAKTANGQNAWLAQMRAYIVSNAICDIGTNGNTANKVNGDINIADDAPNAAFIAARKIVIPDVL